MLSADEKTQIYRHAVECQNGCNAQGIANLLIQVYALAREECPDTEYVNRHPAVILVLDKLYSLADAFGSVAKFNAAFDTCSERGGVPDSTHSYSDTMR